MENKKVLFGTQIKTVLVDEDNEDRQLFGSHAASPRTGFFQVTERPDGTLEVDKFIPVSDEEYRELKKLGVFDPEKFGKPE